MPFAHADTPVTIREDGLYVLTAPLIWSGTTRKQAKRRVLTVLAGFITDLASVPRLFRALMRVAGRNDRPAILHDSLCEAQRLAWLAGRKPAIDSVDTDGIFRAALREVGIRRLEREMYWMGVRWGALASPYRRAGWWRTLPRLAVVSAPLLPLLVLYVPGVLLTQGLLWLLGALLDRWDPACPHRRAANMSRARALAERGGHNFLLVEPADVARERLAAAQITAGLGVQGRKVSAEEIARFRPGGFVQVSGDLSRADAEKIQGRFAQGLDPAVADRSFRGGVDR